MRQLMPSWLPGYRRPWLRADLLAGLSAAAVVIPKALAYASIAGLPVEVGLYTAFLPMLVYAWLGSSATLSVSTSTTIAVLVAVALERATEAGGQAQLLTASATLTCLVGATLLAARALRLGFLADFISAPVLTGFKAGIGLVILVDQLPKLFGLHAASGTVSQELRAFVQVLPGANLHAVALGAAVVVLMLVLSRLAPRVPAALLVVAAGIGWGWSGLAPAWLPMVGMVPTGLPGLTLPDPHLVLTLLPPALGIALMSFTETIAAGRAFARGDAGRPVPDRELLATGLANVAGACFGAMAAGGGTTQTAVNYSAGARSQLAGLVTALVALAVMLLAAPLIGRLPQAVLAAIVIVYSVGLVRPGEFLAILRVRQLELVWAMAALAGVLLLGTLQGIEVAVVVSLLGLAYQAADPPVYVLGRKRGTNVFRPLSAEHPDDEAFPGLLLLRPEGRIFFGNTPVLVEKLRPMIAQAQPAVIAVDMTGVFDLEYTALLRLTDAERRLRAEQGIALWLVGMNPEVLALVRRSPLGKTLGRERMLFNLEAAVARYLGTPVLATRRAGGEAPSMTARQ